MCSSDLQREFNEYLKSPLKEKEMDDSIYMYKKLDIQGVLIECGFISNDIERERLLSSEYQDRIVDSIIEGLINYYN